MNSSTVAGFIASILVIAIVVVCVHGYISSTTDRPKLPWQHTEEPPSRDKATDGHTYVRIYVHDPNCPCGKGKEIQND